MKIKLSVSKYSGSKRATVELTSEKDPKLTFSCNTYYFKDVEIAEKLLQEQGD